MPWDAVMHKWKEGRLKSSSGQPVHSQEQAVAIMLSEKRAAERGKREYAAKDDREEAEKMRTYRHG